MKNEKKMIAPNECSTLRWLSVILVGVLFGLLASAPFGSLLQNRVDTVMGIAYADFFGVLTFIPMFLGMVLAIRFLGKTSLKDFILGVGGKEYPSARGLGGSVCIFDSVHALDNLDSNYL